MIEKTLRKLKKRNVQSNLKQFLAVILISFLSTVLLLGFVINWWTLKKSVDTFYSKTNLPNLWLGVDGITEEDEAFFDENNYTIDKRLYLETNVLLMDKKGNPFSRIYVSNGKLSTPFVSSKTEGCFIEEKDAEKFGIQVGFDEVVFQYFVEELGSYQSLKFRVVGTMNLSEDANISKQMRVFIDEDVFLAEVNRVLRVAGEEKRTGIEHNQILVKGDNISKTKIEEYYKTSSSEILYQFEREDLVSVQMLNDELELAEKYIFVFPVLFFVVCVLIILSTIRNLIIEEQSRIGMLKALGIGNAKIRKYYASFGSYLCAIGSIFGAVLSLFIIPEIMLTKYSENYSIPREYLRLKFPWLVAVLIVVAIIVLGFLTAFSQCSKLLNKNPIECFRPHFDIGVNLKNKNDKVAKIPLSIKMAGRNLKQSFLRTIMALIGMACTVSLMFVGFAAKTTIEKSSVYSARETTLAFMNTIKVFAVMLAVVVFLNLLVQIMRERTHEIATLKALGISLKTMFFSVIIEVLMIAVISFVVGVGLGFPLLILVLKIGKSPFENIPLKVAFFDIFSVFLIIFSIIFVIALLCWLWIRKIDIIKTIKTNE